MNHVVLRLFDLQCARVKYVFVNFAHLSPSLQSLEHPRTTIQMLRSVLSSLIYQVLRQLVSINFLTCCSLVRPSIYLNWEHFRSSMGERNQDEKRSRKQFESGSSEILSTMMFPHWICNKQFMRNIGGHKSVKRISYTALHYFFLLLAIIEKNCKLSIWCFK